jgi:hypothetical protein
LSASGAQVLVIESGGPDDAPTIAIPSIWFYNVGGPLDYHLPVIPSPRLNQSHIQHGTWSCTWQQQQCHRPDTRNAPGLRRQLRETAIELQMAPIRSSVHVPVATLRAHFQGGDVEKGLAELEKRANVMIDDLLWWTVALATKSSFPKR